MSGNKTRYDWPALCLIGVVDQTTISRELVIIQYVNYTVKLHVSLRGTRMYSRRVSSECNTILHPRNNRIYKIQRLYLKNISNVANSSGRLFSNQCNAVCVTGKHVQNEKPGIVDMES